MTIAACRQDRKFGARRILAVDERGARGWIQAFGVLCWLVVSLINQASAARADGACERFARTDDLFVEVREAAVRVVIVNTSDNCALLFSDNLRTAPGQESDHPTTMLIRVESLAGAELSNWYQYFSGEPRDFLDFTLTRLEPGQARVKRVGIAGLLWRIDGHLEGAGRSRLPWGSTVVVRIKMLLFVDRDAAAGRVRDDSKRIEVETTPFLFKLPAKPL